MSINIAKSYVEVPAPPVRQGGILSVANVIPATGHELLGAEYITDACAPGHVWVDLCYNVEQQLCDPQSTPTPPVGGYKVFDQPSLVEGEPFAVYDGVECGLMSIEEAETRAKARLGYSERRQVDKYMQAWLESSKDLSLTVGSLRDQIMAMEDIAGDLYGGYATLLMPYRMITCGRSQDLVHTAPGGGYETINGTRVGGFAVDYPTAPDPANIYLTGQITFIQGPVESHSVASYTHPDGLTCEPARAIAERMYVPLVECMIVGAQATCDPAP